jgi:hypothetical protein
MAAAPKTKEILAIAIGIASVLALALSFWSVPPRADKTLHARIGQSLASEGLKLLKPGGKFVVIARDTEAFPQPAMDILFETLEVQIRAAGKEIRLVQRIQLDPIRPTAVPPGDFYELLRRAPAGDVIISLLGPPLLQQEDRTKLGRPKACVVALCIGMAAENLAMLFDAGLLHVALIDAASASSKLTRFDQLYTIARANASG